MTRSEKIKMVIAIVVMVLLIDVVRAGFEHRHYSYMAHLNCMLFTDKEYIFVRPDMCFYGRVGNDEEYTYQCVTPPDTCG